MDNNSSVSVIREELKKRKMTYKELSRISGVPLDTLNNFFRGKTKNPRIDTMQAIERALGIRGETLEWTDEEKALGVQEKPMFYLSQEEIEWLEIIIEIKRNRGEEFSKTLKMLMKEIGKENI